MQARRRTLSQFKRSRKQILSAPKFTRRRLMRDAAGIGAACTLLPRLLGQSKTQATEMRTLYFNFSHLEVETTSYSVMIAGKLYPLQRVRPGDAALAEGKLRNSFIARLPDSAITHVLAGAQLPPGISLNYSISKSSNQPPGTWSMPSIFYTFPTSSAARSFERMSAKLSSGQPLPLSAKRLAYGIEHAVTLQDVLDEQDFVDSTDHAAAMIFSHPEVVCADPATGKYVHDTHVASSRALFPLSQAIGQRTAATPQATPGQPNSNEWATLTPITDEDGTQLVNTNPKSHNYGLNYYEPAWHPDLHPLIRTAATTSIGTVKNDTTLGVDVTNAGSLSAQDFTGKIWMRRDGVTSIDQSPGATAVGDDNLSYTLTSPNPGNGFDLSVSLAPNGSNVDVTVTFTNSYVRFLGAWVQFLDGTTVVDKSKVPGISTFPDLDTSTNALYLGLVTPEFEILGIPVENSTRTVTFTFPADVATSAKFLASGLGAGSHTFLETEAVGAGLTLVFNLILPTFLLIIGLGAAIDSFVKFVLLPVVNIIITGILAAGPTSDQAQLHTIILRALIKPPAIKGLLTLAQNVLEWVAINAAGVAAEDAIPIVGTIIQIVGILGATAEIVQTGVETSLSPYTYEYDFVPTRDVAVSLQYDPNNDKFPETATSYKVNAIFDVGKPYTATLSMPSPPVTSLPPVVFRNVPLGGLVRSAVGFYADTGWLAGQGSSAPIVNSPQSKIGITITQKQVPIGPSTQYLHQAKTALDGSGNRVWVSGAPAPVATGTFCENAPGNLCALRSLTVRQGNAKQQGYVGYSWQSYTSGATECFSGGQGQLDFAVNIPDPASTGGYARLPCGLLTATKLVYSLLTQVGANYYVDASSGNNFVRQVHLAPPGFDDPREKMSWGVFNLESIALLLHPSGRLISVNNQNSKIETLILPPTNASDSDTITNSIAQVHSSQGSRPGLIDSPVAAAISPEGVVLVLEQGNNRIHALDTAANPVQYFTKQTSPYFLYLDATNSGDTVYLDMAVEFSGYIYVLSSNQGVYRLDIYHPGQSDTQPISTTQSINGGRLAVDFWRNLYTLNYELLGSTDGGTPNVTEPSVSLWTPSAPSLQF